MAGKLFRYTWNPTTSSGVVILNTTTWHSITDGSAILNHIFIRGSQGTLFNFKLYSPNGSIVFQRKDIDTELNEHPFIGLSGLYTLQIDNCDPNDTFLCEFIFEDKKG